jgi:hypothetical protein
MIGVGKGWGNFQAITSKIFNFSLHPRRIQNQLNESFNLSTFTHTFLYVGPEMSQTGLNRGG